MLHRRHRGVYSLGGAPLSPEAAALAAVLACGPGSALCRLSLAKLLGISRFPAPLIEVISPRRRKVAGARVHHCRSLSPRDITDRDGIPVTTTHRLFVDLADPLTPHQLANVIHQAAYRGLYVEAGDPGRHGALCNGRHNLATLERAMELHRMGSAGTKSGAEDAFLRLDLPEPLVNMHLLGREVDFHWPEHAASSWRSTASTASRGPWPTTAAATRRSSPPAGPSCASAPATSTSAGARSPLEPPRRWRPAQVFGMPLEDAVDEAALGRCDQELLEQELAARIVVGVVGVAEDDSRTPSP